VTFYLLLYKEICNIQIGIRTGPSREFEILLHRTFDKISTNYDGLADLQGGSREERRRLQAYFFLRSSRIEKDDQIARHSIVAF
jgi:hypothetical protein